MDLLVKIVFIVLIISLFISAIYFTVYFAIKNSKKNDGNSQPSGNNQTPSPTHKTGMYTLDADLSNGKIKPGSDQESMRFYVGSDPTHGYVNYGIWNDQVTVTPDGKTIVSAGPISGGSRNMVRLMSKKMYNSGLFVIKADHIPEGLGTWPSFWLTAYEPDSSNWACNGEIDIIEGVNSVDQNSSRNVSTLHTNDKNGVKCRQNGVPGISNGGDCTSNGGGSTDMACGCGKSSICPYGGCGVNLSSSSTFGKGFNEAGGGTYACELTPEGAITIWFFPVGQEPSDLIANDPNPSKWPASNRTVFNPCPGQFSNLQIILNTTLCGDWAGNVYPGGKAKCESDMNGADLSKAYWSIDYIKAFVRSDVYPSSVSLEPVPLRNSVGPKSCSADTPATAGGVDMYQNGCCSSCASGLSPYLIIPAGGSDGKYYCFASESEASANGNKFVSKGGPANCGGGGSGGGGGGGGNLSCTTSAGEDMYNNNNNKCCPCGSGLSPYLIIPTGGSDGKYYCFASDAEASANGKLLSKGGPADCGSVSSNTRQYARKYR